MHPGLISCSPETPLRTVARMMTTYRVHAILVTSHGEERLAGGGAWGIVSDADLLGAAETGDLQEQTASTVATAPVLSVASTDDLARAAAVMVEHGASHVIVSETALTSTGRSPVDARHGQGARGLPRAAPDGVLGHVAAAGASASTATGISSPPWSSRNGGYASVIRAA